MALPTRVRLFSPHRKEASPSYQEACTSLLSSSIKFRRQKSETELPGAVGEVNGELVLNGHRVSVWDNEKLCGWMVGMVAQQYKGT